MHKRPILGAIAVAVAVAAGAPMSVYASLIYQGVTFSFTQVDSNTLQLELSGTPTDDWSTAQFFGGFDIKDVGLDFTTATATLDGPGGVNLLGLNSQLSASNLDCSKSTGETGSVCFDLSPDVALGPRPFDLIYTIDFSRNLNIDPSGPHLQVDFTSTQGGDKVGSLLSENVTLSRVSEVTVPEPGTLLLLGIGLLGVGYVQLRRAG